MPELEAPAHLGSEQTVEIEAAALKQLVDEITEQILQTRSGSPSASPQPRMELPATSGERWKPSHSAGELAALIDHTNLGPEATQAEIERLCAEAREHRFATVCVQPLWVSAAVSRLRGTDVGVCTVVGFPGGAVPTGVKCMEAGLAIRKGATELDMVLPVGMLRQGSLDYVKQDIAGVSALCKRYDVLLKVILEASTLTQEQIAVGCALSRLAGADYVKTSTGVHPAGGATEEHVALMRRVVGNGLGVKAAGGIRTAKAALRMIAAGASRIGTSSGVKMIREIAG